VRKDIFIVYLLHLEGYLVQDVRRFEWFVLKHVRVAYLHYKYLLPFELICWQRYV